MPTARVSVWSGWITLAAMAVPGLLQGQSDSLLPPGLAQEYLRAAAEYRAAAAAAGPQGPVWVAWADHLACLARRGRRDAACPEPVTRPPATVALSGGGGNLARGMVAADGLQDAVTSTVAGVTTYAGGSQEVGFGGGDPLGRFIQQGWNGGARITLLRAGGGGWFAAMTANSALRGQDYECSAWNFPSGFIERMWRQGYLITDLDSDNNGWCAVLSTGVDWGLQTYRREGQFPGQFIEGRWDEGYRITHVAGGGGEWLVVMTRGTHLTAQTYTLEVDFPAGFIRARWDEGYVITDLTAANGHWVVVMSKGSQYPQQQYLGPVAGFPGDLLHRWAQAGYVVTDLAGGSGGWVVVMGRRSVWPE